ncbi:hypothetical protein ACHAPT_004169 [Fusarium lateritium]
MSYPTQELQKNTLYLTISTPEASPNAIAHIYDVDMTWLQGAGSGLGAPMEGADNFEWGLYWHRGQQDGTWYMVHRPGDPEPPALLLGMKTKHRFKSMEMRQSPRLHHHVVGLIRLMRTTDIAGPRITTYLDWLAPRAAMKQQRSIMWAMTVYTRTRTHVAKVRGIVELGVDTSGLIREALQFAHHEVWHGFCEEDYVITLYLAEFVNALTNVTYVYLALRYMYGPGRRGILPTRWDFMSISLLVLGIGSFLFHASLRQTFEFVDELSMLLLSWSMLRTILVMRQTPSMVRLITVILPVFFISFSIFYVWSAKIIYQVIGFWVSLVLIGLRIRYLLYWLKPGFPAQQTHEWAVRTWKAAFICLFGYIIWNIDLEFCAELRNLRQRVGLPWAWIFEFHGWWHILTAIGASQFMGVVREVREEAERMKQE